MQTLSKFRAGLLAAMAMAAPSMAEAQAPAPRVDATGSLGWFLSDRTESGADGRSGDISHRWVFGADAGYYWTEHLKSEIGIAATTEGSSYVVLRTETGAGQPYPYVAGRLFLQDVRLVAQQLYQFGHNAWLHPYVGGGVVVQHERSRIELDRFSRPPGGSEVPDETHDEIRVRPVVSAGLKAYVTPRGFVRADLRASPWTESRDFSLTIGLGMDLQ